MQDGVLTIIVPGPSVPDPDQEPPVQISIP